MPTVRPSIQLRQLQRVQLIKDLDSAMDIFEENAKATSRTLKLMSILYEEAVKYLRSSDMDEISEKQPIACQELNTLLSLVEQLKENLDNLKEASPIIKQVLQTVKVADIEKAIESLGNLSVTDLGKSSDNGNGNGNGNGNSNSSGNGNGNGNGNDYGHGNGKDNGNGKNIDIAELVIDPINWEPRYPKVPRDRALRGFVSYINNPGQFYIHPYGGVAEFNMKVQREQDKLIREGIIKLPNIVKGMFCCARYRDDFYWYRARILEIFYENVDEIEKIKEVKVFFIDYGNSSIVSLEDIMPMSVNISSQKAMALACHFIHADQPTKWPDEATLVMKDLIGELKVQIFFNDGLVKSNPFGIYVDYPVDLLLDDDTKVYEVIRPFAEKAKKEEMKASLQKKN